MADKKTKLELEEQKEIAKKLEKSYEDTSKQLKDSYSPEVQKVLSECGRYSGSVSSTDTGKRLYEFLQDEKARPSEFFRKEMKKMPGWLPDYLLEDFYVTVDSIIKWQTSESYYRRTMRTKKYESFVNRYYYIMSVYHDMGIYGTDIVSLYQEKLPQDILCLYRKKQSDYMSAVSEYWIAAELDRGNKDLHDIILDIIFGEDGQKRLTTSIVRGICMSGDTALYDALGKLLLAAKLQEGLRQAVCENMDYGTAEAFKTIFRVIKDNDLLRYASVMRAVATWTGLIASEESKLDRIQSRQLLLIDTYLNDEKARDEALCGEDAMKMYLALWSYGFYDVDEACHVMLKMSLEGSRHQRMVFGMYLKAMYLGKVYSHSVAKAFVRYFPEEMETMAVIMQGFMPDATQYMNDLIYEDGRKYNGVFRKKTYADATRYFQGREECKEFYDILRAMLDRIPKKGIEIDPCVFPWNAEKLGRSEIIIRLAVCASALRDEDKITEIAGMVSEIDAASYSRDTVLLFLVREPANDRQRAILVDAIADKESYTRSAAAKLVKDMQLIPDNYTQVENMLKFKRAEIRETALAILYKLDGGDMDALVGRLLTDSKEEKRTAGLDLLLQMKNDEKRQSLFEGCVHYIDDAKGSGVKFSTKEQIIIGEIQEDSKDRPGADEGYGLYDVNADYQPVFDEDYLAECRSVYVRYFPDSGIANGKLSGADSDMRETSGLSGALAKVKSLFKSKNDVDNPESDAGTYSGSVTNILKKLDALIDAHKNDEYEDRNGDIQMLGGQYGMRYLGKSDRIAFEEMWLDFYEKNIKTPELCMQLYIFFNGYNSDKADFVGYCKSFIADMFGPEYAAERVAFGYMYQIRSVVTYLYNRYVPDADKRSIAAVAADYLLSRKDELVYKFTSDKKNKADGDSSDTYKLKRSVLSNEQIMIVTKWLDFDINEHGNPLNVDAGSEQAAANETYFAHLLPYNYALAKCHRFSIPTDVENNGGSYYWVKTSNMMDVPTISAYIAAYSRGIISRDFMYKMAFERHNLERSLACVSNVMRFIKERDRQVQTREYKWSYNEIKRMEGIRQILLHNPEKELSDADVRILDTAKKLYEDMSELVLSAELTRGDTETEFSICVYGLKRVYGAEYFVRILAALGTETLERSTYFSTGWYNNGRYGVSRKNSLSHLLQSCIPDADDSAQTLKTYLSGTDISEVRLVEAAMYSPEWIDIIGEYLGWDGFTAGCYYFMAHMNESFDDKRKAMIARYTPLEIEELNDGAFDRTWFTEVYDKLGDKHFQLIYKAAKYISDGAKHTRARKYADAALGKYDEAELMSEIEAKRNKDLLMALGILPIKDETQIKDRYIFLQKFKKESRQFGAQRRASEAAAVQMSLRNMAINAGYRDVTRLTLRMESLVAQGMTEYFTPHEVGEVSIWLEMEDGGKCNVICEKNGKQLKSIPAKIKKDEYVVALTDAKKQMAEQGRRTKAMLEDAMESQEEFTWAEIKGMLDNPVIRDMVKSVVFMTAGGYTFGLAEDDGFEVLAGSVGAHRITLSYDTKLTVAHPFHMYKAGVWHDIQKYIFAGKIVQPFKQVFRELYVKTDEELNMEHSLRYASNQIQPKKTIGCLKSRHWVADIEDGLQKVYYKENIIARIYALADWFSPADIESPTLEWVVFSDRKTGKDLKIKDIPDIIFSEVMRDVDMAVSVAHAGGVDPETSHSTVEMRKAIAEFTMPLFKLSNVTFTKNHAVIEGKRANYTVHLGSGVVHQESGPMINVLPVHSQRRGRIFLPFVDDDPKTAEVLTKILFFAEDNKIKDPYVLEQIEQ